MFLLRFLLFGFLALLLWACRTPSPDFSRQKLLQVALLFGYDHPSAYRKLDEVLKQAMAELTQVNATIFGRQPQRQFSRREQRRDARQKATIKPGLQDSYLARVAWKKQQLQQIIAQDFDVLVLFGDELFDLDQSLEAARQAGLLVIYCGFVGKPLLSSASLAPQDSPIPSVPFLQPYKNPLSPDDYPYRESPRSEILNESAERGHLLDEDYEGNPIASGAAPLPYIGDTDTFLPGVADSAATPKRASLSQSAAVHINIRPVSIEVLARRFAQFLTAEPAVSNLPRRAAPTPGAATGTAPGAEGRRQPSALLLFGPSELPFTRAIYRHMQKVISAERDYILAVHFLDPLRIDSADAIRRALRQLPASGRILVLEPLLLYNSAQILQRYGLGLQLAGLGWEELDGPGNIRMLVPLQYSSMAYAALYAAFALYSGQNQGRIGEYFFLGRYGQRQLGADGSLVLHN